MSNNKVVSLGFKTRVDCPIEIFKISPFNSFYLISR